MKFGPMPPKVHPERRPPNEPAMNDYAVFTMALSISSQSISSFMLCFLSCLVVGGVVRALPFADGTDVAVCSEWAVK